MQTLFRIIPASLLALTLIAPAGGISIQTTSANGTPSDEMTTDTLPNAQMHSITVNGLTHANGQAHAAQGITSLDSLPNFNGHFHIAGFNSNGSPQSAWYTNTVGYMPGDGGTTTINAPVIPVALDMRDTFGNPRYVEGHRLYYDPSPYIAPTLNSPVFQNYTYSSSSTPTQLTDAIQRAEYYQPMASDWHTLLAPTVKPTRVMTLIQGDYRFRLNRDGTCCLYVLVDAVTFDYEFRPHSSPADNSTIVGAAELAGDITTKDMSTFLFPNTFLYENNDPNQCCGFGYHGADIEPGTASNGNISRAYIYNFSTWTSTNIFNFGVQDITALSHEIAETYNDPFVVFDNLHDLTPWWKAPNGHCQNSLEVGDVVEFLPNMTYPIAMNGMTYHPQNEALLQWFEGVKSDALGGAYSYPDTSILKNPMVSQKAYCQP
ncbi:MAG: hypothetical protein NVS4B9_42080 [Ktedonobacteraceae bacterium]